MRFIKKIPLRGCKRIRKGFLWFPKTVWSGYTNYWNTRDTRWLCWAKWEEKYSHLGYSQYMWWKPIRWID